MDEHIGPIKVTWLTPCHTAGAWTVAVMDPPPRLMLYPFPQQCLSEPRPTFSTTVVPKVWSPDSRHQHHLGTCQTCLLLSLRPNESEAQQSGFQQALLDSDAISSLRTTALQNNDSSLDLTPEMEESPCILVWSLTWVHPSSPLTVSSFWLIPADTIEL